MYRMAGLLLALMVMLLSLSVAEPYTASDCKMIESEIKSLEATSNNYTKLTMYAYYSKLADKYFQLGECYQDIGMSGSAYFSMAGNYYEKAGDAYFADPSKQYEYYISAGDAFSLSGEKGNALRCFEKAKQVLYSNPQIHVNPAYVNQRIYELQNPLGVTKNNKENYTFGLVPIGIGLLVLFGVVLTFYYIMKKY